MVKSRRELGVFLSKLKVFDKPSRHLEQYATDSDIASTYLWHAYMQGNIQDKKIIDFGCGTGILGIGALLLGARHVEFIDIDASVYRLLKENLALTEENWEIELPGKWTFSNSNITNCSTGFDSDSVVIMNPPFGTQEKHIDKQFLVAAFARAQVIYTMHKTSTTDFIKKFVKDNNFGVFFEMPVKYPLKQTQSNHKKRLERIDVTIFGLQKV